MQADARDEKRSSAPASTGQGAGGLLPTDADNLYIILTARDLNPDPRLRPSLRAQAERRLIKAGATHVISPHPRGASRIARMISTERHDFVEMATERENLQLQMEEILVSPRAASRASRSWRRGSCRKHPHPRGGHQRRGRHHDVQPRGSTRIQARRRAHRSRPPREGGPVLASKEACGGGGLGMRGWGDEGGEGLRSE